MINIVDFSWLNIFRYNSDTFLPKPNHLIRYVKKSVGIIINFLEKLSMFKKACNTKFITHVYPISAYQQQF